MRFKHINNLGPGRQIVGRASLILPLVLLPSFFLTFIIMPTHADELNPGVYSIDSKPFDVSYHEWVGRWWNWTAGIPADAHPRDNVEASCNIHQSGPVWFLPDPLSEEPVTRVCDVPVGKAIFIPIVTGELSSIERPDYSDEQLIEHAGDCDDTSIRSAEVDGVNIKGLDDNITYRTNTSKIFNFAIGEDNVYNWKPGVYHSFAEGWFLFLEPLKPGEHTIQLKGIITSTIPDCSTSGDVTWRIRAQ
jgi:hypothetical protein